MSKVEGQRVTQFHRARHPVSVADAGCMIAEAVGIVPVSFHAPPSSMKASIPLRSQDVNQTTKNISISFPGERTKQRGAGRPAELQRELWRQQQLHAVHAGTPHVLVAVHMAKGLWYPANPKQAHATEVGTRQQNTQSPSHPTHANTATCTPHLHMHAGLHRRAAHTLVRELAADLYQHAPAGGQFAAAAVEERWHRAARHEPHLHLQLLVVDDDAVVSKRGPRARPSAGATAAHARGQTAIPRRLLGCWVAQRAQRVRQPVAHKRLGDAAGVVVREPQRAGILPQVGAQQQLVCVFMCGWGLCGCGGG